jgi:hypothetical protein
MPNEIEIQTFVQWAADWMRESSREFCDIICRTLVESHDWSANKTIEIPSRFTRDGNPISYTF